MYRDNYSTNLSFKTELRAVPSPRAEVRAVSQLSFLFCAIWALACLAYYLVLKTYKITFDTRPDDLMHVIVTGVVPILFTPALPMHSVVRVFLAWRDRGRVRVKFDETGLKLAHVGESRQQNKQIASSLDVQIGTSQHIVATAEGSDAPFSFRLADEPAARRLAVALRAGNSGSSTFSFPVWVGEEVLSVLAGKNVRPSPWRKRGSLALLVSAFGSAAWMTRGSYTAYGVWLLGGPFALIKPWHVGDRHELELIKATIEAFQARAAEGSSGASPPNP